MGEATGRPNANGALNEFPTQYPGTGQHYDKVDEISADDDSTYLEESSVDDLDELFQTDISQIAGKVKQITVYFRMKFASGGGSGRALIRVGSTNYDGDAESQPASYTTYNHTWTTNPATGKAWTWSEVLALQIGARMKQSSGSGRLTQVYMVVETHPLYLTQANLQVT